MENKTRNFEALKNDLENVKNAYDFGSTDLFSYHKGTPRRIKVRLSSSNASGAYYHITPNKFGLNSAPFDPSFEVVSSHFAVMRIEQSIVRHIDCSLSHYELPKWFLDKITATGDFAKDENGIPILTPTPVILYQGWCSWEGFEDFEKNMRRLTAIYVFFDAIDVHSLREDVQNYLLNISTPRETFEEGQGHLEIALRDITREESEQISLLLLESGTEVTLYNHVVKSKYILKSLSYDNHRYVWLYNISEGIPNWATVDIFSYDHEKISFCLYRDRILCLSHPVPQKDVD